MNRIYSVFKLLRGIAIFLFVLSCTSLHDNKHTLSLWYKQPAKEWTEALPVGNGRLGAMVYGKTDQEQIQLNEESLWAGSKINNNNPGALTHLDEIRHLLLTGQVTKALDLSNKYLLGTPPRIRSYQTLGDLFIDFGDHSEVKNYRRELDLKTGIARTKYEQSGIRYTREVFSSAPDNLIVIYIKAKNGKINAKLKLQREINAVFEACDNNIVMRGQIIDKDIPECGPGGEHMKFASCLIAKPIDGSINAEGDQLLVKDASSLMLLVTAATDYNRDSLNFDRTINPLEVCREILAKAETKTYKQLLDTHISDHRSLFNRVHLDICNQDVDTIPTDVRLKQMTEGADDPHLIELYFQYGRYLLMGSSRAPGVLPANLQGIWNNHLEAPWNSDFHTNINLQMNYWPSDVCNLPETMEPLIGFFQELTEPGKITARQMYGCDGWTLHHLTDPFGRTGLMDGIQWGTFPMAGAWMSLHFWDHFRFSGDTTFLRNQIWPVLKGSARFVLDFLIPDEKGQLVTAPSYSPENAYLLPGIKEPMQLTYASAIDIQIVRELLNACTIVSKTLKEDRPFIDSLQTAIKQLPPIRVGENGTIMEWIEDYEEAEPGHRHMSHLFGLHPGTQITPDTPELFEAAAKTIERRLANGGGHTGWSRAWIINFYARLLDGEKAYTHLQALLSKSTLPNLFDSHPPFQIDGNFGGTAGIAEMLLQSHADFLHVLPALPAAWKNGSVRGLRARGNYEVDIYWKDGMLQKLVLRAFNNQRCKIRYLSNDIELRVKKGKVYSFETGLD
jgi:alpha-L-fucosidase 2